MNYDPLFYWVKERERIRVRKEARKPFPWTRDTILSTYRFCNVRREDDRVTKWIKANIRRRFNNHPHLWLMLCIARQINWPDTLRDLIEDGSWPDVSNFDPRDITTTLNARKRHGKKIYTGAYMIAAPSQKGANKQQYIAETVIGELWKDRRFFVDFFDCRPSLRDTHIQLMNYLGWGKFMAYQAIVDMRYTRLLRDAPDRHNWAATGPGTLRGLNRLHGRPTKQRISQGQALAEMRKIYSIIERETNVAMDFSDVPNVLCETDKYLRVERGEGRPRAFYVPGRGS